MLAASLFQWQSVILLKDKLKTSFTTKLEQVNKSYTISSQYYISSVIRQKDEF